MYKEILSNKEELAKEILSEMYETEWTDVERKTKALKDVEWTVMFLVHSMKLKNDVIFKNYYKWMKKLFTTLNLEHHHLDLLLEKTSFVLTKHYGSSINDFLNSIDFNEEYKPLFLIENDLEDEMNEYIDLVMHANKVKAKELIDSLIERNISVEKIYLNIFQESLRHVGEMWLTGEISVAMEHYFTAVTQYLMSTLYELIFTESKNKKKVLACSVGSELHEVGIRMVADLFELHGWNSRYLGANVPLKDIIAFANDFKPDLIALSVTMPYHIVNLQEVIEELKSNKATKDIKIIVGGKPFIQNKKIFEELKADLFAIDAIEGIKSANELFS